MARDDGVAGPAGSVRAGVFECSAADGGRRAALSGSRTASRPSPCPPAGRAYSGHACPPVRQLVASRAHGPGRHGRRSWCSAASCSCGVTRRQRAEPVPGHGVPVERRFPTGRRSADRRPAPGIGPASGALAGRSTSWRGRDYDIDDAAFMANDGTRIVSRTWGRGRPTRAHPSCSTSGCSSPPRRPPRRTSRRPCRRCPRPTPRGCGPPSPARRPSATRPTCSASTPRATRAPVSIRAYLFRVGPVVAKVVAGGRRPSAPARPRRSRGQQPPAWWRRVRRPRDRPARGPPRRPATALLPSLPSGDLTPLLLAHIPDAIAPDLHPRRPAAVGGRAGDPGVLADRRRRHGHLQRLRHRRPHGRRVPVLARHHRPVRGWRPPATSAPSRGRTSWTARRSGQITCWQEGNGQAIMWSDDRLSMLSVAVSPSLDPAGLYLWWEGAGPIP